ncbi:MAG TPA: hypothetical protein VGU46_03700 [Acidobacteriaceae bacterium]|nr:hypothetical protein [Acidobacteriaceae bacterium]
MSLLSVRILFSSLLLSIHQASGHLLLGRTAYKIYFNLYWLGFGLESILMLMVVYGVFKLAMAPLKGLQTLGILVFKWAAGISMAVALGSAMTPHMTGASYFIAAMSQLQRTQSILTLCLLLFVCFAVQPMGLSYKSRIFGVSLGLGVLATHDLVESAWFAFHSNGQLGGTNILVNCLVLATWAAYFALPEPKRRPILLPTTSPFLRWNQISEALGDDPGFVAIAGFPPELLSPAEVEIMRRASLKMGSAPVVEFPVSAFTQERLSNSRAI